MSLVSLYVGDEYRFSDQWVAYISAWHVCSALSAQKLQQRREMTCIDMHICESCLLIESSVNVIYLHVKCVQQVRAETTAAATYDSTTYTTWHTTYHIRHTPHDIPHTTYHIRHTTQRHTPHDIPHTTHHIPHTAYDSRACSAFGLFCRILSFSQGSFAKETYNLKEPTNRSHPIHIYVYMWVLYIYISISECHISTNEMCVAPSDAAMRWLRLVGSFKS